MNPLKTARTNTMLALTLLAALAASGCSTLAGFGSTLTTLYIDQATNAALDAAVAPRVAASAGPSHQVVVNEVAILDASGSAVVSGSGSQNFSPTPGLAFEWSIIDSPVTDQDNDGDVDVDDLAAAGVTFQFSDTAFAQLSSTAAGQYIVQVSVSWAGGLGGATITDTATTSVIVFSTTP
jgi:hypothetical protein